ncbi:MAG TPA: glycosyltransferase family 39 protein [Acetobacteraceae bacterium]|nr:glycosyltransferase family 39 protein [Acetobacteraceae bacterium]
MSTDGVSEGRHSRFWVAAIAAIYLAFSSIFATTPLDIDEFTFVREPYEMLGGDYTMGYLRRHEYAKALKTIAKSYYLFWYYRPLNAPVIGAGFRSMFKTEERTFGYVEPSSVKFDDPAAIEKYKARLIVPEPDRFYSHGAGKPLLPALLSMPQLAVAKALGITGDDILDAQYRGRPSLIFLVLRLAQLLAGLASVVLLFRILEKTFSFQRACLGAFVFATFPVVIKYFPNLHQDSILVPFVLLTVYLRLGGRFAAAGVAYGLSLASKNLAIIVAPALAIDLLIRGVTVWREEGAQSALAFLRPQLTGLALMAAVAFVTFLPFANPVTYAEEILTPVISRPIDPRGENVRQWTVTGIVDDTSQLSPQVTFAQKFLYFNDLGFMFFVLAIGLAFQRKLTSIGRLSIIIIVIYLPISSVFGLTLTYRTLLLVPFFSIAVTELLQIRQLQWLSAATSVLALIYVSNPGRTDLIHNRQTIESPTRK